MQRSSACDRRYTYDAEMSVFGGQVQRSVAVGGRLIDISMVQQQQLHEAVVTLPRSVVQRTHVCSSHSDNNHQYYTLRTATRVS